MDDVVDDDGDDEDEELDEIEGTVNIIYMWICIPISTCFGSHIYHYLLFIIYYLLFIIYYLLFIIYYLLFIIYYLLLIIYYFNVFRFGVGSDRWECFVKRDNELDCQAKGRRFGKAWSP
jgi:hypothetical protein